MEITASAVKELREKTGAGMMDCKKALGETAGDFEKAVDYLRKKGIASASKKAGRTAKEGTIHAYTSTDGKSAILVEVNCETDFVAKTEQFKKFVNDMSNHITAANPSDVAAMLTQNFVGNPSQTVDVTIREAIATLGENMLVSRFARYPLSAGVEATSYIHAGGKVGVLVEFAIAAKGKEPAFQEYARNVAMHIAAAMPQYVNPKDVPAELVAKEKEIAVAQMVASGKPAAVLEKIAEGKINKFYEETCLVKQRYVKDPDKTIEAYTKEVSTALGSPISITRFARFGLGEMAKTESEAN